VLLTAFCLTGCASLPRDAVLPAYADKATVLEGAEVRFWGDRAPDDMSALTAEKWAQVRANRPELLKKGKRPVISFLAVSGGGPTAHSAPGCS
jgi:hypothetical protein